MGLWKLRRVRAAREFHANDVVRAAQASESLQIIADDRVVCMSVKFWVNCSS